MKWEGCFWVVLLAYIRIWSQNETKLGFIKSLDTKENNPLAFKHSRAPVTANLSLRELSCFCFLKFTCNF